MDKQEYENIRNRLVALVMNEERLEKEWDTRLYRGYLYFLSENAYFVSASLSLEQIKTSFAEILPDRSILDDRELGTADPEKSWAANGSLKWIEHEFNASDVIPDVIRFFKLMDVKERELVLSIIYVFRLVEDTLRKYSESFTVQSEWGYGECELRMLYLDILATIDIEQDAKQNWTIIEGIYTKVEDFKFVFEPWMEYVT